MDTNKDAPPVCAPAASFLKAIEGGRAKAANDVLAEFASETERLTVETPNMAGFAILVWEDEGAVQSFVHRGDRNPYGAFMIPMMAADMFKVDVIDGASK